MGNSDKENLLINHQFNYDIISYNERKYSKTQTDKKIVHQNDSSDHKFSFQTKRTLCFTDLEGVESKFHSTTEYLHEISFRHLQFSYCKGLKV